MKEYEVVWLDEDGEPYNAQMIFAYDYTDAIRQACMKCKILGFRVIDMIVRRV
jgi:predicted RecB family endonuclease